MNQALVRLIFSFRVSECIDIITELTQGGRVLIFIPVNVSKFLPVFKGRLSFCLFVYGLDYAIFFLFVETNEAE